MDAKRRTGADARWRRRCGWPGGRATSWAWSVIGERDPRGGSTGGKAAGGATRYRRRRACRREKPQAHAAGPHRRLDPAGVACARSPLRGHRAIASGVVARKLGGALSLGAVSRETGGSRDLRRVGLAPTACRPAVANAVRADVPRSRTSTHGPRASAWSSCRHGLVNPPARSE